LNKIIRLFLVSGLIFAIDQITKIIVRMTMNLHESINVFGDFIRLTYVENSGMAFGISFGYMNLITILSVILTGIAVGYLVVIRNEKNMQPYGIALIVGGAFGNLIDRIFRGGVTDFIDVGIPNYFSDRWWIFNVSDTAITIGIALFLISSYILERDIRRNKDIQE